MAAFFIDSSALVKRYVTERGSTWVKQSVVPTSGNRIYVSRATSVEVVAAIARRAKGGSVAPQDAIATIALFLQHVRTEYRVVELTPVLIDDAIRLAEVHALRAYDAIQLAAALAVRQVRASHGAPALVLVSADLELNTAASIEGLTVIDPP